MRERPFGRLRRVLRPVRRPLVEADDEIRFHIEMRTQELIDHGLPPDEARVLAHRYFGDIQRIRSQLGAMDSWENRRMSFRDWLDARAFDVRSALRALKRFPMVTAAVVATLALGVGANATMFGIVDRLLLRPPAYLIDPSRVHRVFFANTNKDGVESIASGFNYTRYRDLATTTSSFDEYGVTHWGTLPIGTGDAIEDLTVTGMSASMWRMFDAKPVIGRFFGDAEDVVPLGSPVAVVGYEYWRKQLGGNPSALGHRLRIGQATYTIIGVAPPGFGAVDLVPSVAFIPITAMSPEIFGTPVRSYYTEYNSFWLVMLARRKPDVSLDLATADISEAYRRSYTANPNRAPAAVARPRALLAPVLIERGPDASSQSRIVVWLFGVSLAVLFIACANVANLLLTEGLRRRREIAVRLALGIGHGRLVGQLLLESVLLAGLGALGGLAVTQIGGTVLRRVLLPAVAWHSPMSDSRLLIFATLLSLATGVAVGLVPALNALKTNLTPSLKAGAQEGTYRRSRLRMSLLIAQGALSVALLVGAGLFSRSLQKARNVNLGMDPDRVFFLQTRLRGLKLDSIQRADLTERLVGRLRALPEVERLSMTMAPPFQFNAGADLEVPGIDSSRLAGETFFINAVGADFFETMGTRMVRGRGITAQDRAGTQLVVVVSEPMAQRLWPREDPLGKCLKVGKAPAPCRTVVGTVEEIRSGSLSKYDFHYYVASDQYRSAANRIVLRVKQPRKDLNETIRKAVQPIMPAGTLASPQSLREIIDPYYRSWALGATMFSVFGGLAFVLASLGLYSVIAHDITQRRHELGVRMALGARAGDIIRLVVRDGMAVASMGLACGLIIVAVGARWLAPLLFELSPYDPTVIGAVVASLSVVAFLASVVPARRASRVDPTVALRAD